MLKKLFRSKPGTGERIETPAVRENAPVPETTERRVQPRTLPLPEVREDDSDSAWAAFQQAEDPVKVEGGIKPPDQDFDATLYADTVPSGYSKSAGALPAEKYVSTYESVLQEIESEQDALRRRRKKSGN